MKTTEKSINLKDFELMLDVYDGKLRVTITAYKGKDSHVTIPEYIKGLRIERIGHNAFEGNNKIKKITIGKAVNDIEMDAFKDCTELTEVELPDRLSGISYGAFWECKKLAKIKFPDNILFIANDAFANCQKLTSVTIPKDAVEICTFDGGNKLKEIIVDDENLNYSSIDGVLFNEAKTLLVKYPEGKKETNYVIPDTVHSIACNAFKYNCRELVTVTLPRRLVYLHKYTFTDCEKLKKLVMQDGNARFKTIDGVLFDKDEKTLFFYPKGRKETKYTILERTERIKEAAFRKCKNLKTVIFPDSLKFIESEAFSRCENLTSVTLPANLQSISAFAFYNCKKLKKVTLSHKTKIGHKAFDGLSAEFVYID